MLTDIVRGLANLVVPPICPLCDQKQSGSSGFCTNCRAEFLHDPFPSCQRCGATVGPNIVSVDGCYRCRDKRFSFEGVLRVGPYDGLRRDAILRCKFDEVFAECVADVFADGIVAQLGNSRFDYVMSVPLHWWRRWRRGYNQAEVFARALAIASGTKLISGSIRRVRATPFQKSLAASARLENVRGAFRANRRDRLQGKSVLLVDDVVTTGATVDAVASVLRRNGVDRVRVAVIGHG